MASQNTVEINDADREILACLREGRVTPNYVADKTGYSRQHISGRLTRFVELGYVERVAFGLYELSDDPEEASDDE